MRLPEKDGFYDRYAYILNRLKWSKADGDELEGKIDKLEKNPRSYDAAVGSSSSSDDDYCGDYSKWNPEIAWRKALEPALQLYKWAVPKGLISPPVF